MLDICPCVARGNEFLWKFYYATHRATRRAHDTHACARAYTYVHTGEEEGEGPSAAAVVASDSLVAAAACVTLQEHVH